MKKLLWWFLFCGIVACFEKDGLSQNPPAGAIRSGTTQVQGATDGNCLYDNAGKLGDKACGGGGGTPAAPSGSVQFYNSGAFGGDANLIWNNTNKALGIGGSPFPIGSVGNAPSSQFTIRNDDGSLGVSVQASGGGSLFVEMTTTAGGTIGSPTTFDGTMWDRQFWIYNGAAYTQVADIAASGAGSNNTGSLTFTTIGTAGGAALSLNSTQNQASFTAGSTILVTATDIVTVTADTINLNAAGGVIFSAAPGSVSAAVCWKTTQTLSYCTSVVGAGGTCTCH